MEKRQAHSDAVPLRRRPLPKGVAPLVWTLAVLISTVARAQLAVDVHIDAPEVKAVMPATGIGLHTSVYANNFGQPSLPAVIHEGGVQLLRYPGGSYSDIYQWSIHDSLPGGYTAAASHFGNFVRILDQSGGKGMVTVNYGSSHQNTMGGQPKEAAAWVAYANWPSDIFGTDDDVSLGVDEEGNDWRTAGFWSRLRSSTPAEYQSWATPVGLYNSQYNFLAIDRDEPVGIEFWEIGNEIGGNGYFGPQWEYDLHAPYQNGDVNSNVGRVGNPLLSPTAYAANSLEFVAAMRSVDPTIKIGVGLDLTPSQANEEILSVVGNHVDFGIVHWYPGGSNNPNTNANQVLNATDDLPDDYAALRQQIDSLLPENDIELHMTEFGYFGATLADGLDGVFAANTYATVLAEGVQSAHWLELSKNSYVGDAIPSRGPAFYGIQLLSYIAEPGVTWVDTASSNGSIEAHATVLADGGLGLLIANLANGPASDAIVNVEVEGLNLDDVGNEWLYGVDQLTPLLTRRSGDTGSNFTVNVPYRSIVALVIPGRIVVTGDYNADGVVSAADYVVWRNSLDQQVDPGTGADGDGDGTITFLDYDVWRLEFLDSSNAGSSTTLPEPSTMLLLIGTLLVTNVRRGGRRRLVEPRRGS